MDFVSTKSGFHRFLIKSNLLYENRWIFYTMISMITYVLKKLIILLGSLFIIITTTFYLIKSIPGDPFTDSQLLPKEVVQSLLSHYGLDEPLYKQYVHYLCKLIRLDFGESIKYENKSVSQIIFQGLPISLSLSITALLCALGIGILIGSLVSIYSNRSNRICLLYTSPSPRD